MKVIIIGGGYIARPHITEIRNLGSEVAWLVGRNAQRTERFARENSIPHWTVDLNEALAGDADFVHICTPPAQHAELIRACLAAGKNIICEKPLSLDPAEAAVLAEEARKSYEEKGIITALCCNVRFYPANIEAARLISQSSSGAKIISGTYLQEFHIPPHLDGWRFDQVLSGGQRAVSEIGTHWIDLAHAWTGLKITEVFADLRTWYPVRYRKGNMLTLEEDGERVEVDTEDTAAVLLRFENGAVGTLLLSETSPGHPNDLSIEVTDLKTSYRWEEAAPEKLWYSKAGEMKCSAVPVVGRDETFARLFSAAYKAAAGKPHSVYPTFEDGAYIAAVCHAIKRSGEEGTWVKVDK